jgi:hypothetical protein
MPMTHARQAGHQVQRGMPLAARPGQPAGGCQAHDAGREHGDAGQGGAVHRRQRRGAAGQRGHHWHPGDRRSRTEGRQNRCRDREDDTDGECLPRQVRRSGQRAPPIWSQALARPACSSRHPCLPPQPGQVLPCRGRRCACGTAGPVSARSGPEADADKGGTGTAVIAFGDLAELRGDIHAGTVGEWPERWRRPCCVIFSRLVPAAVHPCGVIS